MGLIAPSSGALLSSRSSLLSDEYTELEWLCFIALLLLFSYVTLSISQTPHSSSSASVSLVKLSERILSPVNMSPWTYFTSENCPHGHYSSVNSVPPSE